MSIQNIIVGKLTSHIVNNIPYSVTYILFEHVLFQLNSYCQTVCLYFMLIISLKYMKPILFFGKIDNFSYVFYWPLYLTTYIIFYPFLNIFFIYFTYLIFLLLFRSMSYKNITTVSTHLVLYFKESSKFSNNYLIENRKLIIYKAHFWIHY